jgi:hypothetical protein
MDYDDVFPDEVLRLPLKRYIEFTINLVLGASIVSKVPY